MLRNQASPNFGLHGHLGDVFPGRNKWFGMKTINECLLSLFLLTYDPLSDKIIECHDKTKRTEALITLQKQRD